MAALAVVLAGATNINFGVALFAVLGGIVLIIWRLITRDIDREAAHVRILEAEINRRAGHRLLTWESEHGGAKIGYWAGFWEGRANSD